MKNTQIAQNYKKYNTIEARHAALNHMFFSVACIVANIDGKINKLEKESIIKEFPFFEATKNPFKNQTSEVESLYFCCRRILKFCNENNQIIKNLFVKILKIISSDGAINAREIEVIEKLIKYLKLPEELAYKTFEVYFAVPSKAKIKALTKSELKKLMVSLHPDKFFSLELKDKKLKTKIINLANSRLQVLNEYYSK